MAPHPDYRPNPDRSVYVQGQINRELVERLTPRILELQHAYRDAITVYIDSRGGDPQEMFNLLRLLRAPAQDDRFPCRTITVAVTEASSAAADLLASGDYALAYPNCRILFHGGRFSNIRTLTAEATTMYAQWLRVSNENAAMELAQQVEFRFMFRFTWNMTSKFDDIRAEINSPNLSNIDCFMEFVKPNISSSAFKILERAKNRHKRYEDLVDFILKKKKRVRGNKTPLEWEGVELRAIVEFEVQQNKDENDWSFQYGGLEGLNSDFLLFRTYEELIHSSRFKNACERYGKFLVSPEEEAQIEAIEDEAQRLAMWAEKTSPTLKPIWSFFVALCYTLQQGEDLFLSAEDAYWMGLIDEVIGREDLFHFRWIKERPDQANDGDEDANAETESE